MTDNGYYPELDHLCAQQPAGRGMSGTGACQHPSGQWKDPMNQTQKEFKDYFCPFCGHRLFRGSVRDFKMVCHQCNRLVDSKVLDNAEDNESSD